jgi:predicted RNA-binding Zn ribbon-like protein
VSAQTHPVRLLGGRIAIDFANLTESRAVSWEELIRFLEASRIVSPERGSQLLGLTQTDPQTADALLQKARRLCESLRIILGASMRKEKLQRAWIESINEILRITEGHDELVLDGGNWQMEFIAREGGLDWLLAAIARSGAEIVTEGAKARIRLCANPACGLFFYDDSRTHRRRWCSMSVCGNRHKVAAFARKHAASIKKMAASAS